MKKGIASSKGLKRKEHDMMERNEKVKTHFKDVMDGCYYDWIDPNGCIPFTRTRPVITSGVRRLMSLFDASFDGDSISGGGISCGTDTPIVVKLTGTLRTYVCEYFRDKGFSESEVKRRLSARKEWFGIVDGEHSHSAIKRLIDAKPKWAGYKWFVTVVKSGFTIERYRQLARMQNERHDNQYFIDYTFFDVISNMRTEYEVLSQNQKRVTGQDVVNEYCGYRVTSKKISTLIQTANTAMRLPTSVINAIGEVSNTEHPDLVLCSQKLNQRGATTTDEVMEKQDCRVYRNFIHITSLKSAKVFMNAKHKLGEQAQVNTIYRAQDVYRDRKYSKPVQPDEISKQYELSIYALEEEEKFLKFIAPDKWPSEMETLRQNLLRTVQLNDEIVLNHGNIEILPSIVNAYKRHFPSKFREKQKPPSSTLPPELNSKEDGAQDYNSNVQNTLNKNLDASNKKAPPSTVARNKSDKSQSKTTDPATSTPKIIDTGSQLDSLKEKGVVCHNMKWQCFLSEQWNVNNKLVDAVITNPPPSPSLSFFNDESNKKGGSSDLEGELSSKDIKEVVNSGKRLLKPGGYFIVMVDFEMFQEWYTAFRATGYHVMKRLLTFSYKQDGISRRFSDEQHFPCGVQEYCVVARMPGTHPEEFNPNFNTSFNLIECNLLRRASIVTNVDLPKNRLLQPNTRKPFRMSEKPVNLLAEIIDLFVPHYGSVIDLFGGTFTLAIAALKTSRRCIAIEEDKKCFESAVNRLDNLCNPVFKFVSQTKRREPRKEDISSVGTSLCTLNKMDCLSTSNDSAMVSRNDRNTAILNNFIEDTSKDPDDILGNTCEDSDSQDKCMSLRTTGTLKQVISKVKNAKPQNVSLNSNNNVDEESVPNRLYRGAKSVEGVKQSSNQSTTVQASTAEALLLLNKK